jgi:integrase
MGKINRRPSIYPGVYRLISEIKKDKGKPDVCFYITYKHEAKKIWEKIGWASDGYSVSMANNTRGERLKNNAGPPKKATPPLFKEVAKKYIDWAAENKTRAGIDDANRYKNHLAAVFDKQRMDQISAFDLERLKSDLFKKGLAPSTVRQVLILFRQIWNKGRVWGIWKSENPIHGVKMPVCQNQRERFLSYEEADQLLKILAKSSPLVHDMALVSLHCGLRFGEIAALRGHDLDLTNDLISITNPKNKSARKAYMTKAVKEMFQQRIPEVPDDLIFKDRTHGGRINILSQTYRKTVKEIGFNKNVTDSRQKVTFHTLRHTFASWLALQGTPIFTISQLLGHKSLAMTARYSHLSPDHKKEAAMSLERVFNQKINGNVAAIKKGA